VQREAREGWHVESEEDCTLMLCGATIPLLGSVKVRSSWGTYRCADCWMILEREGGALGVAEDEE
jgi:hypothetical protein